MSEFFVHWKEDGDATVLGRLTARNASGAATGVDGEGKFIQQADVSTITAKVFDLDSADPDSEIATPSVTISDAILDTPDASNEIWTKDAIGYNFVHDLAGSNFPTGNRRYRVEYTVTLSGGAVFHGSYEGRAAPIRSS